MIIIKTATRDNLRKAASLYFKFTIQISCILCLVLTVLSCNAGSPSEKRAKRAAKAKGDVVIGVVYSSTYSNFFLEGVSMAADEINQEIGGLSGRKIRTVVYNDMNDAVVSKEIAKKLAGNDDVVAVIGHGNSQAAISASVIYEKEGIVFISYGATDPNLTRYSKGFTLRNIPDYEAFGHQIAQYAHNSKFGKIAVFYERSSVHRGFAETFKKQADKLGIKIVASRSYFKGDNEFKSVISDLKKKSEFASVFITGSLPDAAILVSQLREMDVNVPILGGDSLDSPDLWAIAGKAAENTVVPTVFYPGYLSKYTRTFVKRFESRYSFVPDTWAAQGYDALLILGSAIIKNGSTVPADIITTLRFFENWKGVTGSYSLTQEGNVEGKRIFFKTMKGGEFVFPKIDQDYNPDLFNYIADYTLRMPLSHAISTIDPGLTRWPTSVEITEQLFLGLTDLDPTTYQAVPELATEWSISPDGKRYMFEMRQDARWTDGQPVTAHDVVWAIQRNIHPDTKSPHAYMLYSLKNAEAINKGKIKDISQLGVYAKDDFTLVFKLERPVAYFPVLAGLWVYRPLPKAAIEKHKDLWTDVANIQTNGPYLLDSWEKGIGMLLKKNPTYYDAKNVSVPEIRYFVISQPSLGLAMYENNELDIMGSSYLRLPFSAIPRIKENPVLKDEYSEYPHFCTYMYAFNTKRPPTDNLLVRKAVSSAIDRQLLIDAANEGNGQPATTCTRPPVFGSVPEEEGTGIGFDPVQAREWLAQAGYPGGKDFPEITLACKKSKFHEKIARAIQAHLEHHLNITVKRLHENDKDYYELVTRGDPPNIFHTKMCADYPDANSWMSRFDPTASFYRTGWENFEFTELISKARETSDREQRKTFYRRLEKILCEEDVVGVPLYFEIYNSLTKPRVKGWYHMPMGGQHIRNWRLEEE